MTEKNIALVDNQAFLDFITEEANPTLGESAAAEFLSSAGATPNTNNEELKMALEAMFDERVDRGLNFIFLPGIPFFGTASTCS